MKRILINRILINRSETFNLTKMPRWFDLDSATPFRKSGDTPPEKSSTMWRTEKGHWIYETQGVSNGPGISKTQYEEISPERAVAWFINNDLEFPEPLKYAVDETEI